MHYRIIQKRYKQSHSKMVSDLIVPHVIAVVSRTPEKVILYRMPEITAPAMDAAGNNFKNLFILCEF